MDRNVKNEFQLKTCLCLLTTTQFIRNKRAPLLDVRRPREREGRIRLSVQQLANSLAKCGEELLTKPWVLLHPGPIPRTRMWQRDQRRPILAPRPYDLGEGMVTPPKMVCLRVSTHYKRQFNMAKSAQQQFPPCRGALRTWRQIAGLTCPWVTEPHGKNGNFSWIVEGIRIDPHPPPKSITTGVMERNPALMDFPARRLRSNKDAGLRMSLQNRTRPKR